VLKLMYAALIRAAERWRGLRMTEFERRQLIAIRNELDRAHAERTAPVVSPNVTASPTRLSARLGLDLLEATKGFRRLKAHKYLLVLRAALAAHQCKYIAQRVEHNADAA
jgi:hypothetical protein